MKRISVCCLVLGFLAAQATAYMVHEEPEEETDETIRGKRQQNDVRVIGNVFNIPLTTVGTVTEMKKNKWQLKLRDAKLANKTEIVKAKNEYDSTSSSANDIEQRQRIEAKRLIEAQREQQRIYEEQLRRRRFELVLQHNKRMQQQIIQEGKRPHSHIYRDPYGFNALTKWIVGPRGIFNGHTGHGDGHVYQFFNKEKPLHFGGHRQRDNRSQQVKQQDQEPKPSVREKSTLALSSTSTTTSTTTTASSATIPSISRARPAHYYEVREVVDEGINTFTWPNWFGIISTLDKAAHTRPDRVQNNIAPKKAKVNFNELPPQSNIASADQDDYKSKYAQARKNYNASEAELTGNEIDSDLESSEKRLTLIERGEKILLPNN